jgi:hypothetical protein
VLPLQACLSTNIDIFRNITLCGFLPAVMKISHLASDMSNILISYGEP